MQTPTTSVIVTCYNVERWIERTLQSAIAQTYPIEIICVDDCSTDGTLAILKIYQAKHPGIITVIEHPVNRKQGAALNTGMRYALGNGTTPRHKYMAFLDADDVWEQTKIEACVKALEEDYYRGQFNQHVPMVYTDGWQIGPSEERYKPLMPVGHKPPTPDELLLNPEMSPSQVVINAAALNGTGFGHELKFNENIVPNDHEFFLRLRERGPFLYIDQKLSHYRRHPGQMSASRPMWADGFRVAYDTFRRDRGHYRYRTFVKRFAVILYRLGEHDKKQRKYLAWAGRWIAAAILDPWRAVKTVVGARS